MSSSSFPRSNAIDILKALGMFCVVYGHIDTGMFARVIYLFHMPLFFLIGGYLFKLRPEQSGWNYFKEKLKSLGVPYVFYFIALYTLQMAFELKPYLNNHELFKTHLLEALQKALWGGSQLTGFVGVFWYVSCFFMVQQGFCFLSKRLNIKALGLFSLIFALIAYAIQFLVPTLYSVGNFHITLMAFSWFYLGFLLKNQHFSFGKSKIQQMVLYAVALGGVMLAAHPEFGPSFTQNFKFGQYGIPFLSFIFAWACIGVLWKWSQVLENFSQTQMVRFLVYVGQASLTIMFIHQFFQLTLRKSGVLEMPFLLGVVVILLSLGFHFVIARFTWGKKYLLGLKQSKISHT